VWQFLIRRIILLGQHTQSSLGSGNPNARRESNFSRGWARGQIEHQGDAEKKEFVR
jgi:hypothetical protein